MRSDLRAAVSALAIFTGLTGVVYPLVVTGIGATFFPAAVRGSLVITADTVRGSAFVGQSFTGAGHLWSRPSAIALPYDARGSGASNLGPTNPRLDSLVQAQIHRLRATASDSAAPVPVELVTASGSGLDPHLSPAAALVQVRRIAAARHLDSATVDRVIRSRIEPRTLGVLGEARVNVLRVNLALDSLAASPEPSKS